MFRKATLFTLVLALIVIILGSYVRLSDAGLGCPDWPGCYGKAVISDDAEFKAQAEQNFPQSPLNISKAWKEMTHRYVAGVLGILVLILAVTAWTQKKCRLASVTSTSLLLVLVGLQAALGMWTVTMKVMPIIVTAHLLLGFITFWLIYWIYLRVHPQVELTKKAGGLGLRLFTGFAMFVLFLQIILGGWTSTNFAGLACAEFPKCNGSWLPMVDYLSALDLFSGLRTGYAGVLSFDGQVAIHWMHRVGALVCFILLTWVMLNATSENQSKQLKKAGLFLSGLLLVQLLLGIFSVKLELPLWMAVAHNAMAVLLMLPLIAISFYSKYSIVDEALLETVEQAVSKTIEVGYVEPSSESLYLRLKTQLQKTRTGLGDVLSTIPLGQKEINEDLLEQIESSLLIADIGVSVTTEIIAKLTESLERHQLNDGEALEVALKQILLDILKPSNQLLEIPEQDSPFVILVVGINGVGKTTTIGKMAKRLQAQGHSVMLAAGDTFRAAAVEQLEVWGERNNIHVVAQHTGADSASVIYDGVQSAKAKGVDVLIADTAGRLHTKSNLMEELSKIKRIMSKVDETAPHEVLLVLDAGTGQNAISQTKIFNESVELTGLALTKLDGTAKGGVIFALANQFGLPIRYIGVGEGIDDLQDFDAETFVDALFVKD
ncbi:MAG: signal recognition particle-docking protein FtsY [Methylococcales bacterium]|nr:signal recognition particle-docking protein FtsY [Methylococcales bacterium]